MGRVGLGNEYEMAWWDLSSVGRSIPLSDTRDDSEKDDRNNDNMKMMMMMFVTDVGGSVV